jgi:hypothetical protein
MSSFCIDPTQDYVAELKPDAHPFPMISAGRANAGRVQALLLEISIQE